MTENQGKLRLVDGNASGIAAAQGWLWLGDGNVSGMAAARG